MAINDRSDSTNDRDNSNLLGRHDYTDANGQVVTSTDITNLGSDEVAHNFFHQ